MTTPSDELKTYIENQLAEAQRCATAYRAQAVQCRQLRFGLENTLGACDDDADLELFVVGRIAEAAKAEHENLRLAGMHLTEVIAHRARLDRLLLGR